MTRRVLHLIDPANAVVGGCVSALAADVLNRSSEHTDTVLLIGGMQADRIARRLGLPTRHRVAPAVSHGALGFTAIRRFISRIGGTDLIVAWSLSALSAAVLATPSRLPLVLMLALDPGTRADAHWLRVLMTHRSITVLALSHSVKRSWIQGGVPPDGIHVLRPGIDFSRLQQGDRKTIRRSWGVDDEKTAVIAALGHPSSRLDLSRAAHTVTLARLVGHDALLVVPESGARLDLAEYQTGLSGSVDNLVVDSRLDEPWRVLPGTDIVLMLGDDTKDPDPRQDTLPGRFLRRSAPRRGIERVMSGMLPLIWSAAAGKNIVAEASYAVSELIEHNHSGSLVKPGDMNGLVRRLSELFADPQRSWKLRDTARSEAFSIFSRQRFAADVATVIGQILSNEPIRIPELRVTGGLRFDGKA